MVWSVKLKSLGKIMMFEDSRKVAFGIYLFIVSTLLLTGKFVTSGDWLTCVFLSSALIGGGTIADQLMKDKRDATTATSR